MQMDLLREEYEPVRSHLEPSHQCHLLHDKDQPDDHSDNSIEVDICKHSRNDLVFESSDDPKQTFGRKLMGYARSLRSSIGTGGKPSRFHRLVSKRSSTTDKETEDIEIDMKRLFKTKRKLELGYISFCFITVLCGLIAMTLYEYINSAMYVIWAVCLILNVIIVGTSLMYSNMELNRIEEKYPNRNVKEEWAAILHHELGH